MRIEKRGCCKSLHFATAPFFGFWRLVLFASLWIRQKKALDFFHKGVELLVVFAMGL